jgi:hypothetical protein
VRAAAVGDDPLAGQPTAMGISSRTSVCSGPRWLVRRRWEGHQDDAHDGGSDYSDETTDEPAEQHPDEAALQNWLHQQPPEIVDTRELRPGSGACRNWDFGRGSCRFGRACHFRHNAHSDAHPAWLARRPPVAELREGPTNRFQLTVHNPHRDTDEVFEEMAADPIMRVALGVGPKGIESSDPGWGTVTGTLPSGVRRSGHGAGCGDTTECWWLVPDPSVLLVCASRTNSTSQTNASQTNAYLPPEQPNGFVSFFRWSCLLRNGSNSAPPEYINGFVSGCRWTCFVHSGIEYGGPCTL